VTTPTIEADSDIVSDTLKKELDTWSAFYATVNDYEEPARPSAADVLACREELWARLDESLGQTEYGPDGLSGMVEGRTFLLGISAGVLSCRSTDLSAKETTLSDGVYGVHGLLPGQDGDEDTNRATLSRRSLEIDMGVRIDPETGELEEDDEPGPGRTEIVEWSRQSRSRMTRMLASLDYSGWVRADGSLAMVTLTLPDDWKSLAPDGKTWKKLLRKFEYRWRRAVGPWRLLWKLEFQRRGAPHFHALMRVPALVTADGGYGKGYGPNAKNGWSGITETFESWLSRTWADVCGASKEIDTIGRWVRASDGWEIDETANDGQGSSEFTRHWAAGTRTDFSGKDFSDPRRISMYFAGHSAKSTDGKEYQHLVPAKWQRPGAGPGRFWGFAGLVNATVEVQVTQRDFDRLRREMRKLARARAWTVAVKRSHGHAVRDGRTPAALPTIRAPKVRKSNLGGRGGQNGGWVLLNDALSVVRALSVWLTDTSGCRPACSWCGHVEPSAA
jgi:hypothetical protein